MHRHSGARSGLGAGDGSSIPSPSTSVCSGRLSPGSRTVSRRTARRGGRLSQPSAGLTFTEPGHPRLGCAEPTVASITSTTSGSSTPSFLSRPRRQVDDARCGQLRRDGSPDPPPTPRRRTTWSASTPSSSSTRTGSRSICSWTAEAGSLVGRPQMASAHQRRCWSGSSRPEFDVSPDFEDARRRTRRRAAASSAAARLRGLPSVLPPLGTGDPALVEGPVSASLLTSSLGFPPLRMCQLTHTTTCPPWFRLRRLVAGRTRVRRSGAMASAFRRVPRRAPSSTASGRVDIWANVGVTAPAAPRAPGPSSPTSSTWRTIFDVSSTSPASIRPEPPHSKPSAASRPRRPSGTCAGAPGQAGSQGPSPPGPLAAHTGSKASRRPGISMRFAGGKAARANVSEFPKQPIGRTF